ncbi:MAG: hypothetical protein AAF657_08245 [Acidobacteriota bacterium]
MRRDSAVRRVRKNSGARGIAVLLSLLPVLALAGQAQSQSPVEAVELRPGALIAPSHGTAFTMTPDGGLTAIDLADGRVRWISAEAALPLALEGSRLLALADQRDALDVVVLDVDRRGRLVGRGALPLPATAWQRIDDGLGQSLRAYFLPDPQTPSVLWESSQRVVRGAPERQVMPVAGGSAAVGTPRPSQLERGAVAVDLVRGTVALRPPELPVPAVPLARRRILEGTDRLDNVGGNGPQFLSANGQHVLSSVRIADDRTWSNRRWTIYERVTGRWLGSVEAHRSYADFVVVGTSLIYVALPNLRRDGDHFIEEVLTLRARRLGDGQEQFAHALRDTRYYGPFPP